MLYSVCGRREEKIQQVFFNGQEIGQRVKDLCQQLAIQELNNNSEKNIWEAITQSIAIIKHKFKNTEEKNHNKKILESLLTAIENNKDKIDFTNRKSSNPIPFNSQQSQDFTDREKTAGIIESFNYYYHNTLLKDGNVFVDLPGIDAPIEADAQIALDKLKDEKTSAIIFILETASKGEITLPEREVMDIINNNSSISSRVFWLFNRIDSIWKGEESDEYKAYKKVRDEEFSSKERCYETSALLGLYGNLLLSAGELNQSNEFGLQSLMNQAIYNKNQQFFEAFKAYLISPKLKGKYTVNVMNDEKPEDTYKRVVEKHSKALIEQMVKDSGVNEFRQGIENYLNTEKWPALYQDLSEPLSDLSLRLRDIYINQNENFKREPKTLADFEYVEQKQISEKLKQLSEKIAQSITQKVDEVVAKKNTEFENDFNVLKTKVNQRFNQLIDDSFIDNIKNSTTNNSSNRGYVTFPRLAILVEAFYFLADGLKEVMLEESQKLIQSFFTELHNTIRTDCSELFQYFKNENEVIKQVENLEKDVKFAIQTNVRDQCVSYVREGKGFYSNNNNFNQILAGVFPELNTDQKEQKSNPDTKEQIITLFKTDFEPKLQDTLDNKLYEGITQPLVDNLRKKCDSLKEVIQNNPEGIKYISDAQITRDAQQKLDQYNSDKNKIDQNIKAYNVAINNINNDPDWISYNIKKLIDIPISDSNSTPN